MYFDFFLRVFVLVEVRALRVFSMPNMNLDAQTMMMMIMVMVTLTIIVIMMMVPTMITTMIRVKKIALVRIIYKKDNNNYDDKNDNNDDYNDANETKSRKFSPTVITLIPLTLHVVNTC